MKIEEETEPETALTEAEIQELMAIGDRFGSLITGKGLQDITKPEMQKATELIIHSTAAKIAAQQTDLLTGLLVAIAWGMYVAESGFSQLTTDLTNLQ